MSVCHPNKCLECVKHGAEWPLEEKSMAIHISYVYNCLWDHGSSLFMEQLVLPGVVSWLFLLFSGVPFNGLWITTKYSNRQVLPVVIFYYCFHITVFKIAAPWSVWTRALIYSHKYLVFVTVSLEDSWSCSLPSF